MDARAKYIAFVAASVAALILGYLARERGWLREQTSQRIHFHTVLWIWGISGVFAMWVLPLHAELLWYLPIVPAAMAAVTFGVIPLAKAIGCTRQQVGVMAVGSGISNTGFTLGGYLCYSLLTPADDALGYSSAMTFIMLVLAIPMIYPVAHHYGSTEPGDHTVLGLVWESLIGIRAWGLYGSLVGLALALLRVPMPRQVYDWHILDALFFLSAIGGYFGIGMRLRLSDALGFSKQHVLLATMKFVAMPLATLAMLLAVDLTPFPLPPLAWHVLLIESLMPAGISTVILANLFHLDARMGSTLWIWNTAVFLGVVMPALVWWYG